MKRIVRFFRRVFGLCALCGHTARVHYPSWLRGEMPEREQQPGQPCCGACYGRELPNGPWVAGPNEPRAWHEFTP